MKAIQALTAALCLALMATGCAVTEMRSVTKTPDSGFLGKDASLLTPGDISKGQVGLRYFNPSAQWRQYTKIIIEPVTFWGDDTTKVKPPDQQALATYFRGAFEKEFAQQFEIVTTPAPGVVRLQVAITDAEETAELCWQRLIDLTPQLPEVTPALLADFHRIRDDERRHGQIFRILTDALDEIRVMCGSQADIVRKKRSSEHVVVAVNRIRAPNDWDRRCAPRGVDRGVIEAIGQRYPVRDAGVFVISRKGTAAIQNGSQPIDSHVFRRHVANVRLHHLCDLLLEREPAQQLGDAGLDPRISRHRACYRRPNNGLRYQRTI